MQRVKYGYMVAFAAVAFADTLPKIVTLIMGVKGCGGDDWSSRRHRVGDESIDASSGTAPSLTPSSDLAAPPPTPYLAAPPNVAAPSEPARGRGAELTRRRVLGTAAVGYE